MARLLLELFETIVVYDIAGKVIKSIWISEPSEENKGKGFRVWESSHEKLFQLTKQNVN